MGTNKQIEPRNVEIQKNILRVMKLRGIENPNQLAEKLKGKVTQPGLYMLLRNPEENNPTIKTLRAIAKVLEVEAWMLVIPDFPFEAIRHRPIDRFHPLTYSIVETMEKEPELVKLLITESVSHALCKIDVKHSHEIKEVQAAYLKKTSKDQDDD